ncbi:MAG: hypothetical protein JST75_03415 [Bacteroidetes bacterium]|nr:hypothetical protein [Bacteroidota bacterium]
MLDSIDLTINVVVLLGIISVAILAGYYFGKLQLKKKQMKILELRKEIVWNHAQILELQKEYVALESNLKANKVPVLPLNPQVIDYMEEAKKVSDGFM